MYTYYVILILVFSVIIIWGIWLVWMTRNLLTILCLYIKTVNSGKNYPNLYFLGNYVWNFKLFEHVGTIAYNYTRATSWYCERTRVTHELFVIISLSMGVIFILSLWYFVHYQHIDKISITLYHTNHVVPNLDENSEIIKHEMTPGIRFKII